MLLLQSECNIIHTIQYVGMLFSQHPLPRLYHLHFHLFRLAHRP